MRNTDPLPYPREPETASSKDLCSGKRSFCCVLLTYLLVMVALRFLGLLDEPTKELVAALGNHTGLALVTVLFSHVIVFGVIGYGLIKLDEGHTPTG
jgi:hypothetical protein